MPKITIDTSTILESAVLKGGLWGLAIGLAVSWGAGAAVAVSEEGLSFVEGIGGCIVFVTPIFIVIGALIGKAES